MDELCSQKGIKAFSDKSVKVNDDLIALFQSIIIIIKFNNILVSVSSQKEGKAKNVSFGIKYQRLSIHIS
jgi:hypothetical protein